MKLHHESMNWSQVKSIPGLLFKVRRIIIVEIIDILNSSKNWVMKWSVYSEKGKFTREVADKHSHHHIY